MTPDDHDDFRKQVETCAAGGLSEEDAACLDAHLEQCPECVGTLKRLRDAEVEVIQVVEPPPPPLRERWRRRRTVIGSKLGSPLLVAAGMLLLGTVGYAISGLSPFPPEAYVAVDEAPEVMVVAPSARPVLPSDAGGFRELPRFDDAIPPSEEPLIFFPEARSDHNESAEDRRSVSAGMRGRAASRTPGVSYSLGAGAGDGGGGRYGTRSGGTRTDPGPEPFDPVKPVAALRLPRGEVAQAGPVPPPNPKAPQPQDVAPGPSRKLIRSGEMEFEIDSFDATVATLTQVTIEEKGFVATVNSEKLPNGKVRGTVVVRVPPEQLDRLLLKLRALGELKSQRIGSEDVTKHFTDLEGRLRAARTMEERLILIIKEGKGQIKDLLQAEKELGEWRTRIESMVGEINYYANLIAHSTLTITLAEKEIRAPYAIVETERVEMGVEVEDVDRAHREALAAVAEAKGRVVKSELKQHAAGQFNAVVQFEVSPPSAGPLRDRLRQLGVVARLDVHRAQETQGGGGKAADAKLRQNDVQVILSLYNVANLVPRDTVLLTLACADPEAAYQAILDRIERASGRVLTSHLTRPRRDLTTGMLQFHVRTVDAAAVLQDVRAAGEVVKLEIQADPEAATVTRSKRGFSVSLLGLGNVQPRESSTVVLASRDVARGYRGLLEAAKAADARILASQLNESDRKNVTATLGFEIRREHETAIAAAMEQAGDVYTRTTSRAQEAEAVVDSKLLVNVRLFPAASIPPRETVAMTLESGDVDGAARKLEADFKGRVADVRHTREASGRRESALTIEVPLKEMAEALDRVKAAGEARDHVATKNADVPDNDLATARFEVRVVNEMLVGSDSGPWAGLRKGLAFSVQAGSWSLTLIVIGLCFVLPLVLAGWAAIRLHRKLRPQT